jgi:hypothetical protein
MPACDDKADVVATDERLEGVIVAVDSAALDDVNSFTLKDGDQTYEVYIADDIDYGFPLGHLQVHVQEALPVVVETETRDGQLYALSIEDG